MGTYAGGDDEFDATGLRVATVAARFNDQVTELLVDGAVATLAQYGVTGDDAPVFWVPGAFELPLVAKRLAESGEWHAVVCLGAVIRGDTPHFEYVAGQCAAGLARVALDTGVPVVFGVLTTDNLDQALARVGGAEGHKGAEAAATALETAALLRTLPPAASFRTPPATGV
jgi:6,7-dimethyl-8-ribityllumazine synthase